MLLDVKRSSKKCDLRVMAFLYAESGIATAYYTRASNEVSINGALQCRGEYSVQKIMIGVPSRWSLQIVPLNINYIIITTFQYCRIGTIWHLGLARIWEACRLKS